MNMNYKSRKFSEGGGGDEEKDNRKKKLAHYITTLYFVMVNNILKIITDTCTPLYILIFLFFIWIKFGFSAFNLKYFLCLQYDTSLLCATTSL